MDDSVAASINTSLPINCYWWALIHRTEAEGAVAFIVRSVVAVPSNKGAVRNKLCSCGGIEA